MTGKIETFTTDENRFLSNFYPYKKGGKFDDVLEIEYDGLKFDCTECAYQAARTDDREMKIRISQMNPYDVVRMLKAGEILSRPGWEGEKLEVMYRLALQKFSKHPQLKKRLLATGDMVLEEGNHWGDVFWGICNGEGENHLGRILMLVRDELRTQPKTRQIAGGER